MKRNTTTTEIMLSPRYRYMNDANYHALVTALAAQIRGCHFTPTELREAVILAAIIVQEETPIPVAVDNWLSGSCDRRPR